MFSISHEQQMLHCQSKQLAFENLWKPHLETAPNCPRCASSNTKFCYYNNYSFSQPRYFCKSCRRYWTKGGTLRNVPVGGGCRKSRRSKFTRSSPISASSSRNFSNDSSNTDDDSITRPSITTSGSGIDLAAVFAKFLNQDVVIEQHEPPDLAMEDHLVQHVSVGAYVEDQKVLQQQQEERVVEEYARPEDPNEFGIPGLLLNDPLVEDALWSDATLTWQPMVQLQEFDQTLNCDNWSCSFDLPNFEVFSMP